MPATSHTAKNFFQSLPPIYAQRSNKNSHLQHQFVAHICMNFVLLCVNIMEHTCMRERQVLREKAKRNFPDILSETIIIEKAERKLFPLW